MISPDGIRTLVIESTSYCNLHCPQCPRFDQQGHLNRFLSPRHLDADRFLNNIEIERLINIQTIEFEGDYGDVMMHPRAQDLLRAFAQTPRVIAVTNGCLRSPAWWRDLAQQNNLTVVFSIDGLEDTNHIYRINSEWNRIMANVQSYISAGGSAIWKFIVFGHNQHQVESARTLSASMGFKDFVVQHTDRSWWTGSRWPVHVDGQYLYDIKPSDSVQELNQPAHIVAMQKLQRNAVDDPSANCWLNSGRVYVNHRGDVLPCCMTSGKTWQKDIDSQMWQRLLGDSDRINIERYSLSEILRSDFYQNGLQRSWQGQPFMHPVCISNCS